MTNPCEGWYSSQRILLLLERSEVEEGPRSGELGPGRLAIFGRVCWKGLPWLFASVRRCVSWSGPWSGSGVAASRCRLLPCRAVPMLPPRRAVPMLPPRSRRKLSSCRSASSLSWAGLGRGSVCVQSRPWSRGANGRTLPVALFYTARTSSVLPSARIAPEIPSILDV